MAQMVHYGDPFGAPKETGQSRHKSVQLLDTKAQPFATAIIGFFGEEITSSGAGPGED